MQKNISIVDETFDCNSASQYELSISFGIDSFSFSVKDLVRNKFIAFRDYVSITSSDINVMLDKFKEIYSHDDILNISFKKVNIISSTEKYLILPNELYLPENNRKILSDSFDLTFSEIVHVNEINKDSSVVLFAIHQEVENYFCHLFKNISFHHSTAVVICHLNQLVKSNAMGVSIQNNNVNIIVLDMGRTVFVNTFPIQSNSDLIYYVQFVLSKLSLLTPPELFIIGKGLTRDLIVEIDALHLKRGQFNNLPNISYSYGFEKLAIQEYLPIFIV